MKIICIGRNYADHAKEMKSQLSSEPIFFLKPDTSYLKPGNPFFIPSFSDNIHYECEIVVKICKVGKNISEKFAPKYYKEIGLGIDFTARDLQEKCKEKGTPWEIAKSFEHSSPISKVFIDKNSIDLNNLSFSLKLNDKIVQRGNSKDMIFNIDHIISYVSKFMTLKTGDLIYTGTPAGVGKVNIGDNLTGYIGEKEMFEVRVK
jgi:2-keto-4-pentenoate hydratase/2-oxohepta-3-ene-1,7-dioic acid hydratase in catechol pathway